MHYDAIIMGHISLDYNTDHLDNTVEVIGGAVTFSSASAYALGHRVAAFTKVAPADKDRLSGLVIPQEDVFCLPASYQVKSSLRKNMLQSLYSILSYRSELSNHVSCIFLSAHLYTSNTC